MRWFWGKLWSMSNCAKLGASAAFYIFALAAQVSDYHSRIAAVVLAAIATLLLIFPLWDWINARREKHGTARFKLATWHLLKWESYVPLHVAAQRALESNVLLAATVRNLEGNRSEDIITWYCKDLQRKTVIYGQRAPSTKIEKFAEPNYDFRIKDGVVIATERSGSGRWEHLAILESDLRAAIGAMNVAR